MNNAKGTGPGLCATCIHARNVPHPRGGAGYWLCGQAGFPKYPRLPVWQCAGYEEAEPKADESS